MASAAEFPDCCGIIILNKFRGGHPGANPDDCLSPSECNSYVAQQEQNYYGKRAGLMAVLSEPQNTRIGEVFVSRKWELQRRVMNPRTGAYLYIYFRDLNPTPARHKRIFATL